MDSRPADRVEAVRRFNRFYTQTIGLLPEGHLRTPHSLAEARVLYEIAHRSDAVAGEVAADLRLDVGYMSRIVRRLASQGLLERQRAGDDARRVILRLTKAGKARFAVLNRRARQDVASVLRPLSPARQAQLTQALETARALLGAGDAAPPAIVLREPRPGDLGWVVQRHGELYAAEYGWNADFEALVAQIVADFAAAHDPSRERCWIAERDGERVGSVFVVAKSRSVAKLRLLLVDPRARGQGLGYRLVAACTAFARQAGYRKLVLWTQSMLVEARHLYVKEGYRLVASDPHHAFGHDLVAETWELPLTERTGRASRPAPAVRRARPRTRRARSR